MSGVGCTLPVCNARFYNGILSRKFSFVSRRMFLKGKKPIGWKIYLVSIYSKWFFYYFFNMDAVIILFCSSDERMDTVDAGLVITVNSLSLSLLLLQKPLNVSETAESHRWRWVGVLGNSLCLLWCHGLLFLLGPVLRMPYGMKPALFSAALTSNLPDLQSSELCCCKRVPIIKK